MFVINYFSNKILDDEHSQAAIVHAGDLEEFVKLLDISCETFDGENYGAIALSLPANNEVLRYN